jgi:hypothetical protein
MTLGNMRRSLSNLLLLLAAGSLVMSLVNCEGGPESPSQLNPQPLPPAKGGDQGNDQGSGAPPSESSGAAGGANSPGSSGSSGAPTTAVPGAADAGPDADGG